MDLQYFGLLQLLMLVLNMELYTRAAHHHQHTIFPVLNIALFGKCGSGLFCGTYLAIPSGSADGTAVQIRIE